MPAPVGFVQSSTGFWTKVSDQSGPYVLDTVGTMTLAGGATSALQTSGNTLATPATVGTQSIVASSAASVVLLAANANRKSFIIHNDDANPLSVLLGAGTASATVYSVALTTGTRYERAPGGAGGYTGIINGIWSVAGAGAARVTEFT